VKTSKIAVDTSFILSILIKRDTTQRAVGTLSKIQERYDEIYVPKQVIGEVVYVLQGIHKYTPQRKKLSKAQVRDFVFSILNTPQLFCEDGKEVVEALNLYVEKGLSFGDALIVSHILAKGIEEILSFDDDFRTIEGLKVYPE